MEQVQAAQPREVPPSAGWRIKAGFTLFIVSIAWPVVLPILPVLGLSGTAIAAFSGVMLVAAELMLVAGVAIAGKDGFAYIKSKVFGVLKAYGPPKTVSRTRYMIGLVLFCVPLAVGFASPYLEHFQVTQYVPVELGQHIPERAENVFTLALVLDAFLICSLFVLGGDFWDKLRSLFIHDARAVLPEESAVKGGA